MEWDLLGQLCGCAKQCECCLFAYKKGCTARELTTDLRLEDMSC